MAEELSFDDQPQPVRALRSFDGFYRREYRDVVGLAFALSGSRIAAEDIAQDAFVAAHKRWEQVGRYDKPEAWVRRVVANLAVSAFRTRVREAGALARLKPRHFVPAPDARRGCRVLEGGAVPAAPPGPGHRPPLPGGPPRRRHRRDPRMRRGHGQGPSPQGTGRALPSPRHFPGGTAMNLESRARRAAASLKASVAGLAAPAGGGAPAPSRRRLVGGLALGGALAAALLVVAVLVLPSSGDPQTVAGADLPSSTTTAAGAGLDGSTTLPEATEGTPGDSRTYPDNGGPHRPDVAPHHHRPRRRPAGRESNASPAPATAASESDQSDILPGFWASQAYGCSAEEEPVELFYGGGEPGETITLDSPYGSATRRGRRRRLLGGRASPSPGPPTTSPSPSPSPTAKASPGNSASWSPTRRTATAPRPSSTSSPPTSCGGARSTSRPPTSSTAPAIPGDTIILESPYGVGHGGRGRVGLVGDDPHLRRRPHRRDASS